MSKKLTESQIRELAKNNGYEYAALRSVIEVESNGNGFGNDGRLVIQFEPHKFSLHLGRIAVPHSLQKKTLNGKTYYIIQGQDITVVGGGPSPYEVSINAWQILNGVEGQTSEYKAFSRAFQFNPDAAMMASSIGLMQVLGEHYNSLGFKTVGEMWDFAKVSEYNQVIIAIRFIKLNKKLDAALKNKDWETFAYYYNGSAYKKFNYHTRMAASYKKFK